MSAGATTRISPPPSLCFAGIDARTFPHQTPGHCPHCGSSRLGASPGPNDRGSNVIFCRRAGEAQRAVLAIKFVKNVITIRANPSLVEASNGQGYSIRKGESLGRIINYKAQVLFASRRRVPGRRTHDNDPCR